MAARFDGKVALITGAGSGMGRAITIRLAGEGAAVFAVDIDEGRLIETKALAEGLAPPDRCQ
jgi:meso-butanediol dehydrogenase/(S,S)-butanediol dehydrogenase/diacetyl reductase